jgi:hypothetical protein
VILDSFGITRWVPPVGEWVDDELESTPTTLVFDVSDRFDQPGRYEVFFRPKAWTGPKIKIRGVELLADGKSISLDNHEGVAGWDWSEADYYLDVPNLSGVDELNLRVVLEAMDRKGGAGEVYVSLLNGP